MQLSEWKAAICNRNCRGHAILIDAKHNHHYIANPKKTWSERASLYPRSHRQFLFRVGTALYGGSYGLLATTSLFTSRRRREVNMYGNTVQVCVGTVSFIPGHEEDLCT
jgi:hypothetical protein